MIIKVDTREQLPLEFVVGKVVKGVRVERLPFGDYWAEHDETGKEYPICFERKSLGDLFGSLTSGIERLKKRIDQCNENKMQMYLLIEVPLTQVYKGFEHSQVAGEQIVKTIFSLKVRHGVEPIFCQDRHEAKCQVVETFRAVERNFKVNQQGGVR